MNAKLKVLLILLLAISLAISARLFFSLSYSQQEEGNAITGFAVKEINESKDMAGENLPDLSRLPNPLRHLSSG